MQLPDQLWRSVVMLLLALAGLLYGYLGLHVIPWAQAYSGQIQSGARANAAILMRAVLMARANGTQLPRDLVLAIVMLILAAFWIRLFGTYGLALALLSLILVILACIDGACRLLPDALTWPLLLIGCVCTPAGFWPALQAAGLMYLLLSGANLAYTCWRHKPGFGGGDVKLMTALAAWFGLLSGLRILWLAALLGLAWCLFSRHGYSRPYAFGPCIALAVLLYLFEYTNVYDLSMFEI